MKQSELLKILEVAGRLKRTTRHCWTGSDRKESVADHSWRIALMAMLLTPEFPELDMDKVKIKALYGRHSPLPGTGLERIERMKSGPFHGQSELLTELGILGDLEYRNFLYTMKNGTKVLIWGNKIARPDQRNILRAERPDIAIVQVTGANKAEDMAVACKEMGCKVVIPHHIDYPGDYSRQTENLKNALAEIAPEITFIIPKYNKWIEL